MPKTVGQIRERLKESIDMCEISLRSDDIDIQNPTEKRSVGDYFIGKYNYLLDLIHWIDEDEDMRWYEEI